MTTTTIAGKTIEEIKAMPADDYAEWVVTLTDDEYENLWKPAPDLAAYFEERRRQEGRAE